MLGERGEFGVGRTRRSGLFVAGVGAPAGTGGVLTVAGGVVRGEDGRGWVEQGGVGCGRFLDRAFALLALWLIVWGCCRRVFH